MKSLATCAGDENGPSEPGKEMKVLERGSDAISAHTTQDATTFTTEKHYRVVSIGKKRLPDPSAPGSGRKESFWATVTAVGVDLTSLGGWAERNTRPRPEVSFRDVFLRN
jgi:hypothetical protein